MAICAKNLCTGCLACCNRCPRDAITVSQDDRGHYVPVIDQNACVGCGMCEQICPALHPVPKNPRPATAYACWLKDRTRREESTSGGVFSALALEILGRGGAVFGAVFDENFDVVHAAILDKNQLGAFRGSKYVQSNIAQAYRSALRHLKKGMPVLFSGTSCQIAGLYAFLPEFFDNLYTVDVLCRCAPSPLYYRDYLNHITDGGARKIERIRFRYKKPGWTVYSMRIDFQDGGPYISDARNDPYLCAFSQGYIGRDCCEVCRYADIRRVADITLADFWGYVSDVRENKNTEEGISLVLINNPRGAELLSRVEGEMVMIPKPIGEAVKGNVGLQYPHPNNARAKEFWGEYLKNRDFEWSARFIGKRTESPRSRIARWTNDHSYLPFVKAARRVYRTARRKHNESCH